VAVNSAPNVIPLGTLSAGEASCRNIAISMGLLADDTNTDEKYNVEKEASTYNKDNAKEWIKSTLTKRKKDVKDVKDVKE
jgi:hypothetical protein